MLTLLPFFFKGKQSYLLVFLYQKLDIKMSVLFIIIIVFLSA